MLTVQYIVTSMRIHLICFDSFNHPGLSIHRLYLHMYSIYYEPLVGVFKGILNLKFLHLIFNLHVCCICVLTGTSTRLSLQVSSDGMRVLVVAITGLVFLWECFDMRDLTGLRDGTVKGRWAHICPLEDNILPSLQDKDACQHTIFVKTEVIYIWNIVPCLVIYRPVLHFLLSPSFFFSSKLL